VTDISPTGLALLSRTYFAPGAVLAIELPAHVPTVSPIYRVTMRRAIELENGRWLLGCQFSRTLDAELYLSLSESRNDWPEPAIVGRPTPRAKRRQPGPLNQSTLSRRSIRLPR
jgi:hypothetical protein